MNKLTLGIAAALIAGLIALFAAGKLNSILPGGADTIAVFNGGEIKQQEILQIVQIDPAMDRETVYNMKLAATMQKVKRRLLEIEAAKQKITPEELVMKNSGAQPAATDDEVNLHLRNLGKDPAKTSAKDMETTRKLVQNKKIMVAGEKYLNELFKNGGVHIYIDK